MVLGHPRTVTFDCWSTVIYEADPEAAEARRIDTVRDLAARAGASVDENEVARVLRLTWDRFDERWLAQLAPTPDDLAAWILELVGAPDISVRGPLAHALATQALERRILPLDGVEQVLRTLHADGVKIGLVCDTGYSPGSTLRQVLARVGLLRFFDVTTFSNEVGVPKPHPRIFEQTLGKLEASAVGAVHVGDLKRTDVAGARALGMRTVRITSHHDDTSEHADADVVVDSHIDLLRELGYEG